MSPAERKVIIVPCSGIGKSYGAITREAAYEVVEELRPGVTRLVALSLLVLGDEERRSLVSENPVIAIDGCPKFCAAKMVQQNGGQDVHQVSVFDAHKGCRNLKPEGIAQLNEDGLELSRVLARRVAEAVDGLRSGRTDGNDPEGER